MSNFFFAPLNNINMEGHNDRDRDDECQRDNKFQELDALVAKSSATENLGLIVRQNLITFDRPKVIIASM